MSRELLRNACLVLLAGPVLGSVLIAQDAPGNVVRYEIWGAWLGLTPKGNVLTNSNRVNFVSDLGMEHMQSQVAFRGLIMPWKRSGLFAEFTPYRFDGEITTTRSFRFGGVTYPANETISSKASLNYLAIGYQYNLIDRQNLELGLQAAVAYIGVRARAISPSVGSADVDRDIPFPLVGLVARYTPDKSPWLSLRGETRGMTFGSLGGYFDVGGAVGFNVSPHTSIEAGYRVIDGDGHRGTRGAQLNFHGPTIGLRVYDK
jgi:hypothetical protein